MSETPHPSHLSYTYGQIVVIGFQQPSTVKAVLHPYLGQALSGPPDYAPSNVTKPGNIVRSC